MYLVITFGRSQCGVVGNLRHDVVVLTAGCAGTEAASLWMAFGIAWRIHNKVR